MAFYSVRGITSTVVYEILESRYFTAYGVPKSIVLDNARDFRPGYFMNLAFDRE